MKVEGRVELGGAVGEKDEREKEGGVDQFVYENHIDNLLFGLLSPGWCFLSGHVLKTVAILFQLLEVFPHSRCECCKEEGKKGEGGRGGEEETGRGRRGKREEEKKKRGVRKGEGNEGEKGEEGRRRR